MHALRRLRARAAGEDGFTMLLVMIVLTVSSLVAVAAYQATSGDARPARYDQSTKAAYSAAQAGLAWFQAELANDPSYWSKCTGVDNIKVGGSYVQAPVWDGMAATPRPWRVVADGTNADAVTTSTSTIPNRAQAYSVELLPAPTKTKCIPGDDTSMIDTFGAFRIRVTGRIGPDVAGQSTPTRAIIATFRRKGFLDYLWYAQYEEVDPQLAAIAQGVPFACTSASCTMGDYATWAQTNCADKYWWGATGRRLLTPWQGDMTSNGGPNVTAAKALLCPDTGFRGGDAINGAFHISDTLLVCSNPSFGNALDTAPLDKIETEDPGGLPNDANGWRDANNASEYNGVPVDRWGCASGSPPNGAPGTMPPNPQWKATGNTLVKGADPITPPASNDSLASAASAGYSFVGKTVIKFGTPSATQMSVWNNNMGLSNKPMTIPQNGVIFVANGSSCTPYDPKFTDNSSDTCGDARIEGQINTSLTIGAQNDIVITNSLTAASLSTNLIGLVAQNYVRVQHPVGTATTSWDGVHSAQAVYNSGGACSTLNYSGTLNGTTYPLTNIQIDAAILTLKHSFMIDNWRCGAGLGNLTINGAIAQKYHGPVSTTAPSGYTKVFNYNGSLRYRSPPAFLAPVQAAWRLVQVQEQAGASGIVGS